MIGAARSLISLFLAQAASAPAASSPATAADASHGPKESLGNQLTGMFGPTLENTSWWGWLMLVLCIAVGVALGRVSRTFCRDLLGRRMETRGWHARASVVNHAAGPLGLALLATMIGMGAQSIYLAPQLSIIVTKTIGLLFILAIGWFLFNLVDLLEYGLRRFAPKNVPVKIDDTVIIMLRKIVRVFLLILLVLFVLQNTFGQQIGAWLAGLGIAGLAVSLAAQDSVKNFFGSLTVLIERPFSLGDRIVFNNYDGVVENIGFRSTKIRTITGNILTVPNMRFTDSMVENITARPFIARTFNVTIPSETAPEKVERAVAIIRAILADPAIAEAFTVTANQPQVFFNQINADSFNISVQYWYGINVPGRDAVSYQDHAQRINLRIVRELSDAEIELAYPTRTLRIANSSSGSLSAGMAS
jgi:MscS family membrane protein